MRKRLLGDEHPNVATSLNNLAALYDDKGRYASAESLYQQALELYKRLLGEEHPNTITVRNNLENLRTIANKPRNLLSKLWKLFRMLVYKST